MPYVRVKKQKKKGAVRRLRHQLSHAKGRKALSFYIFILLAFISALLIGLYLIRKANRIEPEQPVQSMQQAPPPSVTGIT